MDLDIYNQDLFHFLHRSTSPFHAIAEMENRLTESGAVQLSETGDWHLQKYTRYLVVRGGRALIALYTGGLRPWKTGLKMVGAHADSPCLKVKPQPVLTGSGGTRLGVEVYGGALLNSWFDRGLTLAGRLVVRCKPPNSKPGLRSCLIQLDPQVAVIPSLPIHLDREANTNRSVNPQIDLPPLVSSGDENGKTAWRDALTLAAEKALGPDLPPDDITAWELNFADAHPPFFCGLNADMISAPRLDNLLSCHAAVTALTAAKGDTPCLVICADHEEVGSTSATGAAGSFLTDCLSRMIPAPAHRHRAMASSLIISADNAHALHPAHPERFDSEHQPRLNHGPALKINAAMRYTTDSLTHAVFKEICRRAKIPVQRFVMRSDMPCGSTIGPMVSAATGAAAVDIGAPTLGMHAIREVTGKNDPHALFTALKTFFTMEEPPLLSLT